MFSDPVYGEKFFGRQDIIDLLVKRSRAFQSGYRQNVAIIGHQQLGKTSVLRHFLHVFKDPEVLCVYVEIKIQALDYFVDQFIRSLLFQYLHHNGGSDAKLSLQELSAKAEIFIPKTVAKIREIVLCLKHRHADEAYARLFELTSVVKSETGKNCIVILDEFHRLGEFGIKNAFQDFGKRIMVQKDTMYILSSSAFSASKKILVEKLSLLFGNFERVYLEPFSFETAFDFIQQKLSSLTVLEPLKFFLVAFTDGHPFFMDVILNRLRELADARGLTIITPQLAAEALKKLLYESQGVLNQYFMKLISRWTQPDAHGNHVLILVELAKGKSRLKDVAQAVNGRQTDVSARLNDLMSHELIVKNGIFYRFNNKIFKFWLREVYEKRELLFLGFDGSDNFDERMVEIMAEYEALLGLSTEDRIMALFKDFRNDLVEIGEKGRNLPHFTEILKQEASADTSKLRGSSRSIIARGHGRCWVCKIMEEKASEKDVFDFVKATSSQKTSKPTAVLVALNGLDENAKLLAKEKKVLTIGLSRLNTLLDLYNHFPIIPALSTQPQEVRVP